MDLQQFGALMEAQREQIGKTRAELARELGVSANYLWMIERAKPRRSGAPSQPSRRLVERWATILWEGDENLPDIVVGAAVLAGYTPVRRVRGTEKRATGEVTTRRRLAYPAPSLDPEFIEATTEAAARSIGEELDEELRRSNLTREGYQALREVLIPHALRLIELLHGRPHLQ